MQYNFLSVIIPLLLIPILLMALWRIGLRRLQRYSSPLLGNIEVFQKYNGEKVMTINTYAQGVSIENESIKESYWFCVAALVAKYCQEKKDPQILMLGLGSATISNLIAKLNPFIYQTIVEVDKYIILACRKYFNLDKLPNYQLIRADAYKLIEDKNSFGKKFDAIIVDIYIGKPPYISLESIRPNFITKIIPHLKNDGIIVFNKPGNTQESRKDSLKLEEYLKTIFKQTKIFDIQDPRGYRNNEVCGFLKMN